MKMAQNEGFLSGLSSQILQKLMEKLTGQQLQVPEVTQTEEGQRNKLRIVLGFANHVLGLQRGQAKWSVDSVHTKNIVSILHLLVRRKLGDPFWEANPRTTRSKQSRARLARGLYGSNCPRLALFPDG